METIIRVEFIAGALRKIKYRANSGLWNGRDMTAYFESCRWWIEAYECSVIFTRDIYHHTSGWWKNPDYERCWHLSISFRAGKSKPALEKILDGLFGADKKLLWIEPPHSPEGKANDVWHYRLFADQFWQPMKPRGEVYNTDFTEAGYKSYSELNQK